MASNNLKTLNQVFENSFFRIPDYQRGYAWETYQLDDFWEDLENMYKLNNNQKHYTGMITVEEVNRSSVDKMESWSDDLWLFEKGLTAYYVIDGQQRMTTIIILLKNILEKVEEINFQKKEFWEQKFLYQSYENKYKSFVFGYEKDNPSNEYFINEILGFRRATSDKVPLSTLYTINLKNADKYFKDKLKDFDNKNLGELFKKIINGLFFNFYEVSDDLDVFVTFETMNNRGKSLTNLELLKNRLIYLSTMIDEKEAVRDRLRKDINESWKTIYEFLGKNINDTLNDDDFLKNHWIMYFKYDRSISNPEKEFLLKKYFTSKQLLAKEIGYDEIEKYRLNIQNAIKHWYYMHNYSESHYSIEIKLLLDKLNRLGFGAFKPLILSLFVCNETEENIIETLKFAEKYVFLVFKLSDRKSSTGSSQIYGLANKYFEKNIDFEELYELLENELYSKNNSEDVQFRTWDRVDIDKFIKQINNNYEKDGTGFYSWSGLKYFLYEYELSLKEKAKRTEDKLSWDNINQESIEHIYPQTENEYWKSLFSDVEEDTKLRACHTLGNLLLLSNKKNSEIQNKKFDEKKVHYSTGSYSEIEVSKNSQWTIEEIKNRSLDMLEFMSDRWKIIIEEEDRESILDF